MGRKEFEAVVASAPREQFKRFAQNYSTTIPAGGNEVIDVYSTPGTIAEMKTFYFNCSPPPGATSADHRFNAQHPNGGFYFEGVSAAATGMKLNNFCWESSSTSKPTNEVALGHAIRGIRFDDVLPLRLTYYNFTNAAQTSPRTISFMTVERQVGK